MRPLLPATLLALFAAWCGTLGGGSTAAGGLAADLALAAVVAVFLLELGAGGLPRLPLAARAALVAPAALVCLSTLALHGPAWGRSGAWLQAVALGIAFPWLVASWWSRPEDRRRGLVAVSAVLLGVSAWALWTAGGGHWLLVGAPRPALPLGHHNLLAAWLVIVLPLAAVGLGSRGPARVLAALACAAGLAAVLATRSLTGALALAVEAALALLWLRRFRPWVALATVTGLALPGLVLYGPRLAALAAGTDSSLAARATYWRAGWQGFLERPLLGWGNGSVPWTIAEHLAPRPGINPSSEVVGTLHSLPLELAYELGALGLAVIAAAFLAFVWDRARRRGSAADAPLLTAALVSIAGGAAAGLTESWLAIAAVPMAFSLACGAALAATEAGEGAFPARPRSRRDVLFGSLAAAVFVVAALVPSFRRFQAKRHYEAARLASTTEESCSRLRAAARLDPGQPLYRARLAWCGDGDPGMAYAAAVEAHGIGMLWAAAGVLAHQHPAGLGHETEGMLRRALALDPLAAPAPYLLAATDPDRADAAGCAARALLAEPRLVAATFFDEHPDLQSEARRAILAWPGIDPGWRVAMAKRLARPAPPPGDLGTPGEEVALGLGFDDLQGGASLYAFRLLPWRGEWFSVTLDAARLVEPAIPPAAILASSEAAAFPKESCAPPLPGGAPRP